MPSLGNDLKSLRKKQDLSIEDVKESTRIPAHILRSIEDDSIFKNMRNNVTYTRSYVRSYAKAIGIQEADIVDALDRVEKGNYRGELTPDTDLDSNEESGKSEKNSEQDLTEEKSPEQAAKSPPTPKPKQKPVSSKAIKPASDNWDWVQVSRQANAENSRSRRTGILIILILIAAIVAGFVVYTYYYAENKSAESVPENNELQQPTTPSDSLRQALLSKENKPQMNDNMPSEPGEILADTLTIGIYAANGKLEPVRIYTDILGQQNPYWVSQDDTIRFNFVNTVRLRAVNQYDRLQLLFNGHIIQNYYQEYYNSESGMIELDRTVFENHPEWQQPAE